MWLGFRISPWLFAAIIFGGFAVGFSFGYGAGESQRCVDRVTAPPSILHQQVPR